MSMPDPQIPSSTQPGDILVRTVFEKDGSRMVTEGVISEDGTAVWSEPYRVEGWTEEHE